MSRAVSNKAEHNSCHGGERNTQWVDLIPVDLCVHRFVWSGVWVGNNNSQQNKTYAREREETKTASNGGAVLGETE